MIAAHPQLALRAAHAAAGNAAQLRFLDLEVARQHRAHGGHRHLDARRDVRRAAHDLHGFACAHVNRHDVQVVAVRVQLAGEHVPHDHPVERRAGPLHRLHARARQIEPIAERLRVRRHVHIFAQPLQRYFHIVLPIVYARRAYYSEPLPPLAPPKKAKRAGQPLSPCPRLPDPLRPESEHRSSGEPQQRQPCEGDGGAAPTKRVPQRSEDCSSDWAPPRRRRQKP